MRLQLMQENLVITADQEEKYRFVIAVTEGKFRMDDIRNWLILHTTVLSSE